MAKIIGSMEVIIDNDDWISDYNPLSLRETFVKNCLVSEPGMVVGKEPGAYVFVVTLEGFKIMQRLLKISR